MINPHTVAASSAKNIKLPRQKLQVVQGAHVDQGQEGREGWGKGFTNYALSCVGTRLRRWQGWNVCVLK